jgi:hypothetical protein
MRLTSEFWVSQLLRRAFKEGGFAAVMRKGAAEAGSIFIRVRHRSGLSELYGPSPQTSYETDRPQDRLFARILDASEDSGIDAKLEREARFDSDLWIVEIELGDAPAAGLFEITPP